MAFRITKNTPRSEHPRPDIERPLWFNLNGEWELALDSHDVGEREQWFDNGSKPFPLRIIVPFPWESVLSGVHRTDYRGIAWYRRSVRVPAAWKGKRITLRFGAVDWAAKVWVNGEFVGTHEGGYSTFAFDISSLIQAGSDIPVVVRVTDLVDRETPTGKQTGWYTPTSGIWQTVWIEATGAAVVEHMLFASLSDSRGVPNGAVNLDLQIDRGLFRGGIQIGVRSLDRKFAALNKRLNEDENKATLTIRVRNPRFWSPDSPLLYPAIVTLHSVDGPNRISVLDEVRTYFGIRTVTRGPFNQSSFQYVLLNGRPLYLRGVLDQSFNPDGIYTAPDDEYIQSDLNLARRSGFNMVRIHIKADEPRRLYWADRLGLLLMCDVPNMNAYTERARALWEETMRDQIKRDGSHPSIFCWCIFNEEWGIGQPGTAPQEHRVDWVERMFHLTRELDSSRLILDNTGWSHLVTDLNSFHWYGRDVDVFRANYQKINDRHVRAGADWNYIAGRKQGGEPFINNEFGYVSAGDGDGDWSWGVLPLMNAMRACEKLVGYTYTELTDIEWEHNGVESYDRSPKEFGYDFWAPGMSLQDVFAEDFLVLDVPAIKIIPPRKKNRRKIQVPVLFSHQSGRHRISLRLKWCLRWLDNFGNWHEGPILSKTIIPTAAYHLTPIATIRVDLPYQHALATLVVWLENQRGNRIHTNYTQWAVRDDSPSPRMEILDPHTLTLRFSPTDWVESRFSEADKSGKAKLGKHYALGHGFVEYRLELPDGLPIESLESASILCEVSAKAGREKVDWPERVKESDYPQTDQRKFPSTVVVSLAGIPADTWSLPDDPADARGVLSHWNGVDRGSYGYLRHAGLSGIPLRNAVLTGGKNLLVRFIVPWNAQDRGGIALYGEETGCYPLDPTVFLRFTNPLSTKTVSTIESL